MNKLCEDKRSNGPIKEENAIATTVCTKTILQLFYHYQPLGYPCNNKKPDPLQF